MTEAFHGVTEPRGIDFVAESRLHKGRFGRMFPNVPVFPADEAELRRLGDTMEDAEGGSDNPTIPAGYTYLGQFIDHDITFDPVSSLDRFHDPNSLENFRTPRLDLDSLYGSGLQASPYLYDREANPPVRLLTGKAVDDAGNAVADDDLPRNSQGVALVGDPRNDENTFVSQLHLLFIKFHNAIVDHVVSTGMFSTPDDIFKEANRLVRWHYQWIVAHDFLRRIAGDDIVDAILTPAASKPTNRRFFGWSESPFMPVEFSVAAYRFGHSQVRPRYSLNTLVQNLPIFPPGPNPGRLDAFHGFRPLPPRWAASWPFFFELDAEGPQPSRVIDTKLAAGLFTLPGTTGEDAPKLARRNLLRGHKLNLPSGEAVAAAMNEPPLTADELGLEDFNFPNGTPLWYYILGEAERRGDGGSRLGPIGATIVAEVLLGLIDGDPLSYLSVQPLWTPELPAAQDGTFTMADLVRFASPQDAERHGGRA